MSQFTLNLAPERRIWTVSELTARIRDTLAAQFRDLWVEGEISNCRPAQSGHIYFTLKDDRAQVRCVCFRQQARLLKFRPEDGLHVAVRGSVSVYEPRGEYQIYVENIEPVGLGALQLAFEQLKKRLEAEGLFDAGRKRPLPVLPSRIAVVTSPTGAAIRDFLRILRRRHPGLHVLIHPARVQGEGAAEEIVKALGWLNRTLAADVIVLTRGGGSLEDLWTFNEEAVARAIAASQIPVISAVGHEIDFTIADFVADVRAATPSAAAEIVVGTRMEFERHIRELGRRLVQRVKYLLLEWRDQVRELATHTGFQRLEDLLRDRRQQTDELAGRLGEALRVRLDVARRRLTLAQARVAAVDFRARFAAPRSRLEQHASELGARIERRLALWRQKLERVALQLEERSPLRLLERGYAIVSDAAGNVIHSSTAVDAGDLLRVLLAKGRLRVEVKKKEE